MAETKVPSTTSETEVSDLKETLHAQHQMMQKLYVELEEEREASATAVNEALSMILRLQGEKAAEKMEARQYKRMAEEKMHLAEETLAIFEETMYRKDKEIASLEFQLQAFRHKFLSIGFSGVNMGDVQFLGNLLCNDGACPDDISISGKVRRNSSPPVLRLKPLKSVLSEEASLRHMTTRKIEENITHEFDYHYENVSADQLNEKADHEISAMKHGKLSEESAVEDFYSYFKRIVQTGEQLEELSQSENVEVIGTEDISSVKQYQPTCSASFAASSNTSYTSRGGTGTRLDSHVAFSCSGSQTEDLKEVDVYHRKCMETEIVGGSLHSISIQRIIEIPQNHDGYKLSEHQKLVAQKKMFADESWPEKPTDPVLEGTGEHNAEDEKQLPEKALPHSHHNCKWSSPGNREAICCHWALIDNKTGFLLSEVEVLQINKRLQLLEDDREIMKQESSQIRKEELKLLARIHEQLNTLESWITRRKAKKNSTVDEFILVCLMKAMLCFSL